MVSTAEAHPRERAPGHTQRERGRVRLICHEPVDPQRREPVHEHDESGSCSVDHDPRLRVGIAAEVEVRPARYERDDCHAGDDGAFVEPALDIQDEQQSEEDEGDLPGTAATACEAPCRDDERAG
jgi:hypothetical protein